VRYVSPEDEFRYRLDDLIDGLAEEDIEQLKRLEPTAGWPPEIESPTRRVEEVLLLLEEARRAEVDEQALASGTIASLRAHLLARVAPAPAANGEIEQFDAGAHPPATTIRRFRVILHSADGHVIRGYHGYRADVLPTVGDTIDVRERSDEARVIRARVTHVTREHNLPIAATVLDA